MTGVGVLGPLLLAGDDGPVRLGSVRQRRLLVALVAHLGAAVPADVLADLVWDTAPADPAGAMQTNVSRLRRALPGAIRIATVPAGYQLLADRADVDVTAFVDHLAAAGTAGDARQRLDRLAAALALWRGRPYTELDHPSLRPEVVRLLELRVSAVEQHAAALSDTGRVAEAVAALEALTVAEPLREGAVALLMRALVTVGRQGDALAAFARLRTRLAADLGLDPSPELQELEQQVLRQEIQEITARGVGGTQLPATGSRPGADPAPVPRLPVSSFVGRDGDVAGAAALLSGCRVVTLCGPGGVGKTRLARHVAAEVVGRYDDGVLLVGFGDGGPADVEPALAAALRLSDGGPGSLADRIVDVLSVRRQLVLLDNCEHVADEVAELVEAITGAAPAVDVLVTSREPLRVDGEHVFGVDPLDPASAAALLTDRIRAAGPAVAAESEPGELVAELCRRLDGLPLALELAAARAATLGLPGLLAALDVGPDRPLDVLRGGRRTAASRHRSLRDVIAWSYGLLDDDQRRLFDRLAVFAGPVEHAAVAAVCGEPAALPDLVDRSLVVRHAGTPATFGMLETLRAFGRSRLAADAVAAQLRVRHAAWAVQLADELGVARRGPGEAAAVRRFDAHLPDLRRAHGWLCETGPLEDLLRLSVLFGELAYLRGRIDLVRLVEQTLAVAGRAAHPLVARLLGLLATSNWQRGDLAVAESHAHRAIEIAEATGDPSVAREGYEALANVLCFRGDLDGARGQARSALELAEAAGDVETQFLALLDLALVCAYAGDHDAAGRHESAMAGLLFRCDSPTARGFLAYARGELRAERGSPEAAGYLAEAIREAEEVDSRFVAGIARHTLLTTAARGSGEPAEMLASLRPLIDHWHRFGAWTHLWVAVRALIETLSRLDRHGDAAVLLGALRASPRGTPAFGADAARELAVERAARAALGPAFETLRAEGAGLGDAGAVALARRLTRAGGERAEGPAWELSESSGRTG